MKRLQEIYIMEAAVHLDSFLVLHIKLLCTLHATLLISNYIFPQIFSDLHSFSLFSFRWLYYLHKEYEIKKRHSHSRSFVLLASKESTTPDDVRSLSVRWDPL